MIKILNENFSKQVKRELMRNKKYTSDVVVIYTIDNERKTGDLTIDIYDGDDSKEISTPIEFRHEIVSMGVSDGYQIKRIAFTISPTDMVLDIILHDHIIEAWKNAYNWEMQIVKNGNRNNTLYHISMIKFYNAKRSKSTKVEHICFDGKYGYEIIQTE